MTDELLPCPFCGSTDNRVEEDETSGVWNDFRALCNACGASSDYTKVRAEAVAAWNRRTSPPAGEVA